MTGKKSSFILITVCIFILYSFFVFRYLHINLDDQYIFYKYAQNFATHNGFFYNLEQPVEGFSSFLYVVILGSLFKLFNVTDTSTDTIIAMTLTGKILNYLLTLGTLSYMMLFIRKVFKFKPVYLFFTFFPLLISIDFVYSSTNGMETGLFIYLFTACTIHLLYHGIKGFKSWRGLIPVMIYSSLICLARVDGFIFLGVLYSTWLFFYLRYQKPGFTRLIRHALMLAAPVFITLAGYSLFRWIYFNDIFPNTYYVKAPDWDSRILLIAHWIPFKKIVVSNLLRFPIVLGFYVIPFTWGILILIGLVLSAVSFSRHKQKTSRIAGIYHGRVTKSIPGGISIHQAALVLFSTTIILILYIIYIGGDWMPGNRYMQPFLALSRIFLYAMVIQMLIYIFPRYRQFILFPLAAAMILVFGNILTTEQVDKNLWRELYVNSVFKLIKKHHSFYVLYGKGKMFEYFALNTPFLDKLKENLEPADKVAFYESGIPSLSLGLDHHFIDMSGLNNRFFSKTKTDDEGYFTMSLSYVYNNCGEIRGERDRYLLENDPAYIVFDTYFILCDEIPNEILDGNYILENDQFKDFNMFYTVYERADRSTGEFSSFKGTP
jgi:hypothetical protein